MTSILEKLSVRRVALPISVEQYHRLGREGIIGQRTELLRGVIIEHRASLPQILFRIERQFDHTFEELFGPLAGEVVDDQFLGEQATDIA